MSINSQGVIDEIDTFVATMKKHGIQRLKVQTDRSDYIIDLKDPPPDPFVGVPS